MSAAVDRSPEFLEAARDSARYSQCIRESRRVRWDIDADVLRHRQPDFQRRFIPLDPSLAALAEGPGDAADRCLSHVQGRSHLGLLTAFSRFASAAMLDAARGHAFGDQLALEALLRAADEKLKHQQLFRHLERSITEKQPSGYRPAADPDRIARQLCAQSSWARFALVSAVERAVQTHYTQELAVADGVCPLFRDCGRFHWLEARQHQVLAEVEWERADRELAPRDRERAVTELAQIIGIVDGLLQRQAFADAAYFNRIADPDTSVASVANSGESLCHAYRNRYLDAGLRHPQFHRLLAGMAGLTQAQRIRATLAFVPGN